jgi:hypothetical protein
VIAPHLGIFEMPGHGPDAGFGILQVDRQNIVKDRPIGRVREKGTLLIDGYRILAYESAPLADSSPIALDDIHRPLGGDCPGPHAPSRGLR